MEAADEGIAYVVKAWLCITNRVYDRDRIYVQGAAVWAPRRQRLVEVRQTAMDFSLAGGLPDRVPVDDEPRLTALTPLPVVYMLVNRARDAVAVISTAPDHMARWTRETRWVERYGGEETVHLCPRHIVSIHSLRISEAYLRDC